MKSFMYGNRSLRVETQPSTFPPRSPNMKSPNATTPMKGFMKSTASSVSKVTTPRSFNVSPDSRMRDADIREKLMQDLIRFTRSRFVS